MDLEARDEAYKRELQQTGTATLERKWGRFANRTDGPQPYRPATGNSGSGQRGKSDRVRANAVTPQPTAEQSRPQPEREHRKRGRKISKAKRDQLRAAGKCFQCEETGHDQRNCPKLHSMRRPAIHAGNIDIARLERLSNRKNEANLRVNAMAFDLEGVISEDTDAVRQAYELCAVEWG